jgi:hypothetical protein
MKNSLFPFLFVMVLNSWSAASSAALMSPVLINGREWLQPVDFLNTSWNEVQSVCDVADGTCSGSVGSNSLDGWIWASTDDVAELFNFIYGSAYFGIVADVAGTPGVSDTAWAPAFFEAGFIYTYTGSDIGDYTKFRTLNGITRTLDSSGFTANFASVRDAFSPSAYAYDTAGLYTAIGAGVSRENASSYFGHYFYREAASNVPVPSTLVLFGTVLLSLSSRRPSSRS